jgi:hypothetical protein
MTIDQLVKISQEANVAQGKVAETFSTYLRFAISYYKDKDQEWYRAKALEDTKKHYKVKP